MKSVAQKLLVAGFLILSGASAQASQIDLSGGYAGVIRGEQVRPVNILISPIQESPRRYLALLIETTRGGFFSDAVPIRAYAYRIDPVRDGVTFDLTPVHATADGSIGVPNVEPSLTMTLRPTSKDGMTISMSPQAGGSLAGFQETMEFKMKDRSEMSWVSLAAGSYERIGKREQSLGLSVEDSEFRAIADLQLEGSLSGRFILRQGQERLYSLTGFRRSSTGLEAAAQPISLVAFLERKGATWMMLMTPRAETNNYVIALKRE
jgi:hypothetical protein